VNDATDMAAALRGAGFDVILKTDADQQTIKEAVRTFGDALKTKGGVGLFYFAGHGVQVGGENYIVPIGPPVANGEELKAQAVTAAEVVDAMAAARNGLNIVVLDACRDNPLPGMGGTRGLSRIDSSSSLFVSFSTSPGAVALDGAGRNSPYTKHLAEAINAPALTLEDTFKRTLKGVYQETRGEQTPWLSSSFFGNFVFRPAAAPSVAAPAPQPAPRVVHATTSAPALAGVYRADGRNPDGTRYRGMVALYPAGDEFRFTWWIGRGVFHGSGHFAGRMLVVNWGQKHPVIYSFGRGASLEGEWADGTATETLEPFARAAGGAVVPPQGRYQVRGRNPNGSRYGGTVSIVRQADRFNLSWQVGSSAYRGTGVLNGNVLTVDWGSATPVIYALASDGTLKGLWDGGRGEETLVPD
jgi:hypothetical protein